LNYAFIPFRVPTTTTFAILILIKNFRTEMGGMTFNFKKAILYRILILKEFAFVFNWVLLTLLSLISGQDFYKHLYLRYHLNILK
jgi:hypothetical protein